MREHRITKDELGNKYLVTKHHLVPAVVVEDTLIEFPEAEGYDPSEEGYTPPMENRGRAEIPERYETTAFDGHSEHKNRFLADVARIDFGDVSNYVKDYYMKAITNGEFVGYINVTKESVTHIQQG